MRSDIRAILDDPHRDAERLLYDAFARRLGDAFAVFHSVAWLSRPLDAGARDGEADFIVAHRTGEIFVVEVKGGAISHDGGTGRWQSRDRHDRVHEIDDPVKQARDNKYALRDKLRSLPGWRGEPPFLGRAVAFPNCTAPARDLGLDLPRDIVVYSEDLDWIDRKVESILEYWQRESDGRSGSHEATVRLLEGFLAPSFELRSTLAVALREADREILRLTEEQFRLLDFLGRQRRVAVSGGAGTGKTLLALEKARRLAGEGFRTLLTCFNRPLTDHLIRAAGPVANLTVNTFHGFCESMALQAGLEVPTYPGGLAPPEHFTEVLPRLLEQALERMPGERFDAIVVDEGQDFEEAWWLLLQLSQSDPDRGILYIFHDDNQNIYGKKSALPENVSPFPLDWNLRNTRPIHALAMRFYQGALRSQGPEGRPVELVEVADGGSVERELSRVLHRLVNEEGMRPCDIAVLSGRSLRRSVLAGKDRVGAFQIAQEPSDSPNVVRAESIHRFKGLECSVGVLIELEAIFDNAKLEEGKRNELLYVALTRARGHVVAVGSPVTLARLR